MKSILLNGIQKVGSSWTTFVILNYYNILNHKSQKTLTWDEQQAFFKDRREKGVDYEYTDNLPNLHHSHLAWDGQGINKKWEGYPEFFNQFDSLIYVIRNPFDTTLSYWHFMMNREGVDYSVKLRDYLKEYIPKWIHHVKTTRDKADLVLDYDQLRGNPIGFLDAMNLIDNNIDFGILEKSIEMSSFESIKKMSSEVNQPYGLGGPTYKGWHCRDGRSLYRKKMHKDFQLYIRRACEAEGIIL